MSWLVDNANGFYLLLAITSAALVLVWRSNGRVKFLGYAGAAVVAMGLLWLLTRFVISDRKQLELNVIAMANHVKDGQIDDLFKHISHDFRYREMTREILYEKTQAAVREYRIRQVKITQFKVDELDRGQKFAKTTFTVSAWHAGNDHPFVFVTRADFVLEAEQWKVRTLRFYNPFVEQDREMDLPFPR